MYLLLCRVSFSMGLSLCGVLAPVEGLKTLTLPCLRVRQNFSRQVDARILWASCIACHVGLCCDSESAAVPV